MAQVVDTCKVYLRRLHFYSFGLLHRLYHWVLSWADTKYGTHALGAVAFAESSFFLIPPDVLQIALSISKPQRSFYYAFIGTLFSVLGGLFGYFIGAVLFDSIGTAIINALGYQAQFAMVGELYKNNVFMAVFSSALTPIPYKVFTISAGFWRVDMVSFLIASILGRGLRFFMVGTLIYWKGPRIKQFIDEYFSLVTIVVCVLVIAGFVAIKYLV